MTNMINLETVCQKKLVPCWHRCVVVLCLEQQPRVRGWLLASVDGQTSGLVPANYVKVLGKRRGRKHAEAERLVQVRQDHTEALQTGAGTQGISSASNTDASDVLLEAVFAESPPPNSSVTSSTELNVPAKTDLWASYIFVCKCDCFVHM